MRNLILILRAYQKFFFFLALEIICLAVFVRNNNYQFQSYLHSARGVSGALYAKKKKVTSYLNLEEKNKALLAENAKLKSKLGIGIKKNPLKDSSYSRLISSDSVKQTIYYNYVPARVLNNTFDKKNNFLTLNIGANKGLKKDMRVLSRNGVVGIITHVSKNYSLAASVLSDKFSVSSKTPEGTTSTVKWGGTRNPYVAILSGISQSEKLKNGDTITTSAFSRFPPNIMIGRVIKKQKGGANSGSRYKIQLSTNFKKLNFVYVVVDDINMERKVLEDSVKTLVDE